MKIDRLISIITILLQNEKVTASYLAERFEVSRRTISRDIEDICKAGIPVTTMQGANGGITLPDCYKINKTLFTLPELNAVFAGLATLDSVAQDRKYQNIMDKFFSRSEKIRASNHMVIDLSSHYKSSLAPKIKAIQNAIETTSTISFLYYNQSGEKEVALEPYLLVFQWSSWYVFGWNQSYEEFRMYKLNRLWQLKVTSLAYQLREIPSIKEQISQYFTDEIQTVILFDKRVKYRLIDEYGPDCYQETADGKLSFSSPFTNEDYLIDWLMAFGNMAELIEPAGLRAKVKDRLRKTIALYED